MKLYGLKNCDTCRKAQKQLAAAGVDATFVDVRADGVSRDQIEGWIDQAGLKTVLNTRSTTWRGLTEAQKQGDDAAMIDLMAQKPTLIKRPVIESDKGLFIGWTKPTVEALTKN